MFSVPLIAEVIFLVHYGQISTETQTALNHRTAVNDFFHVEIFSHAQTHIPWLFSGWNVVEFHRCVCAFVCMCVGI